MGARRRRRRFFVPEVVQTSAMDCGPAALVAMLAGFGVPANYGRLREACHTDVDGTSIDTIEDIACLLGLEATQVMAPVDHVALRAADVLPAVVVTRRASRFNHFVVAWRRVGPYVQVMDPAVGRRWVRVSRFERDLYIHRFSVPAAAWHAWARSEALVGPLRDQLAGLDVSGSDAEVLIGDAVGAASWEPLAALDAAVRLARVVADGARLDGAVPLVARLAADPDSIAEPYWFARPGSDGGVEVRGAVLVRVSGPAAEPPPVEDLAPDVAAVVTSGRPRPNLEVLRLLWADGLLRPAMLLVGLVLAAVATVGEGLLFRRVIDDSSGGVPPALVSLAGGLLVLELAVALGTLHLGRAMEVRLRHRLFTVLPRLPDPYLRSRPQSDMAERAHHIHQLRTLPAVATVVVRASAEVVCVVVGIAVLDPTGALLAVVAGVAAVAVPLLAVPSVAERDLRMRTQAGALARFFVDALLGLVPLRAHGADATMRAEHARQVDEWAAAGRGLFRASVTAEAISAVVGVVMAVALVATLPAGQGAGTVLLVAFWAVTLPALGQRLAVGLRRYPAIRSVTVRLLEPLAARQDDETDEPEGDVRPAPAAVCLVGVDVVAAGHRVLEGVNLRIAPGEHVAVVGGSGAGKSTLTGLLVGWQRPSVGEVLVDDRRLEGRHLATTRSTLAWVAPEVQLWNTSMHDNIGYGNPPSALTRLDDTVLRAELDGVIARLADGSMGRLGESGRLLSGGEGQRVRLARALLRPGVRLAVLDEPFRGVDRDGRARLLAAARTHWVAATLVFVTHDVSQTMSFDRVVVMDGGVLVEDDRPGELASRTSSLYRRLLEAEAASGVGLWAERAWTHWHLADGRLR